MTRLRKAAKRKLRLLLADDHPMLRQGIRACLTARPDFTIVAEAADGEEALRKARQHAPDIVLMDVNMPRMNGLVATSQLRRELPEVRVLVLTVHHQSEYILEFIRCGAHGYISKDAAPEELIRAVAAVGRGDTFFEARPSDARSRHAAPAPRPDAFRVLSCREREVLGLIVEGLGNKQVAAKLGLSVRTVETHRDRLKRKLGIRTTVGLIRFAITAGLA